MSVLVDTSALYAYIDRNNAQNAAAKSQFTALVESERLVTHNYVVVESVTLVHHRLGGAAARDLIGELIPLMDVVWVDRRLHDSAISALLAAQSRRVSLVDRVSFEVMRRNGIRTAFCFDPDFSRQGFETRP